MKISHMGTNYICSQSFVLDRPAGTDHYLYVMFKSSAFVLSENKLICAEPGSYIIYHPLSPQKYYPHESIFIHDFAHLMPETLEEEGFLERLTCDTLIYPDTVEYINQICLQLCMEYFSNSQYKSQTIDSFCRLLILKLFEQNRSEMGKPSRLNYQYELLRLRAEVYSNLSPVVQEAF